MILVNKALTEVAARETPSGSTSRHRCTANHAIIRNAELGIQLAYTHFNEYLRSVLGEMYDKRPLEIVNKANSSISFHEIAKFESYQAICNYMVDHVFRSLENNRSTKALVEKMLDKTGVVIDPTTSNQAMLYMEIRHLIVHNSSQVDQKFVQTFGDEFNKAGKRLNISLGVSKKAIATICSLCGEIDSGLMSKGYVERHTGRLQE